MTQMAYFYWVNGRIRPSFFYDMPEGELKIIWAFFEKELEELRQLRKE